MASETPATALKCPGCGRYLAHIERQPGVYAMFAPCKCGVQTAVRIGGSTEPLTIPCRASSLAVT
jgi:hypothetical protein